MNKKYKNIVRNKLSSLVLLFVFASLMSIPLIARAASSSLNVVSGSVALGGTISVPITLTAAGNTVDTVGVNVTYDAAKLTCIGIDSSSDFSFDPGGAGCSGGTAHFERSRLGNFSADGTVAYLKFTGAAAGNAAVTIASSSVVYSAGNSVPTNKGSGAVTVNAPSTPAPSAPAPSSTGTTQTTTTTKTTGTTKTTTPAASTSQPAATTSTPAPSSGSQADSTPPLISDVNVTGITDKSATITWTTSEPATSQVEFGLTNTYGLTGGDNAFNTVHSVTLDSTSLQQGIRYHFRVKSTDAAGNSSVGDDGSFQTLGFRVTIIVVDKQRKPINKAAVIYGKSTVKTDKQGKAVLPNVAYGKQKITVKNGTAKVDKSIVVGLLGADGKLAKQVFTVVAPPSGLTPLGIGLIAGGTIGGIGLAIYGLRNWRRLTPLSSLYYKWKYRNNITFNPNPEPAPPAPAQPTVVTPPSTSAESTQESASLPSENITASPQPPSVHETPKPPALTNSQNSNLPQGQWPEQVIKPNNGS